MAQPSFKYRFAIISVSALVCFTAGWALGWFLWRPTPPVEWKPPAPIAYFDKDSVNLIINKDSMAAARFYYANGITQPAGAIMVAVDSQGRHLPEAGGHGFRRYKALSGSHTALDLLDETQARTEVRQARYGNKPPWSVDCPKDVLSDLLAMDKGNGIGLIVLRMANGTCTFGLVPVRIAQSRATVLGSNADMIVGEPCPNFCPDPVGCYLHL